LNAVALANTARREKGATKKNQTHHTNNNNKVPVQTTTKNKNNTCETCDPTNLELSYIHVYSTTLATERERERVHLLLPIFVTAPVFQVDTF